MNIANWLDHHNAKLYPYCGQCYYGDGKRGRWGHCLNCDKERIKYEQNYKRHELETTP